VISPTTLISWIVAYNNGGTDALKMSKGGRPEGNPKWNTSIFTDLAHKIDKGGYWSIPRMMEWIKTHTHKDIPEQTVWYRMDKLGYSYKGARPHPIKGDRERQDTFKKGVSPRSWKKG
jgi:transposase